MEVGDVVGPVLVGAVAHGGHCVARLDGRVIFVRHALPGETVTVRLTDVSKASMWRGDAIEVVAAASGRVVPRCPVAVPGGCGGCDWQFADLSTQRELKRSVVAEQLDRIAGVDWRGHIEAPRGDGYGWRTRMRYVVGQAGLGMRAHRSHAIVPLPIEGCAISASPPPSLSAAVGTEVIVAGSDDDIAVLAGDEIGAGRVVGTEYASGRPYRVAADGFWQVHPDAADILVEAVLAGLEPRPGERALDLYCGVGLFAGALADEGAIVHGVESSAQAVDLARHNVPEATFSAGRVDHWFRRPRRPVDVVVLDPPRTGAGRAVVEGVAATTPRAVAYVACDPAALARDLVTFAAQGYDPTSIRAVDLFPMTHHIECVAVLRST